MNHSLKKYLELGESESLDYKETISNANKIAKTIVSFCNTKGGKIIVGVNDKRKVVGVHPQEEKYMIQLAVDTYCYPKPDIKFEEIEDNNKQVLVVHIAEGNLKPYKSKSQDNKWKAYVRNADRSEIASGIWTLSQHILKNQTQSLVFGNEEQTILKLVKASPCNINTLKKNSKINYFKLRKILANLLILNMIRIDKNGKNEVFHLKE
jgi:predicted HTH transcriptional regulator